MYKTRSKNLQRRSGRDLSSSPANAEAANQQRAPFFYRLQNASRGVGDPLPGNLPPWLLIEIREAGGVERWVRRNAYWQKQLRRQYYSVVAHERGERELARQIPKWLFEEVRLFGRSHWLDMYEPRDKWRKRTGRDQIGSSAPSPVRHRVIAHKPMNAVSATPNSAAEARYRELRALIRTSGKSSNGPLRLFNGKAEYIDVYAKCLHCGRSSRPLWYYPKSTAGPVLICSTCRDRLRSDVSDKHDALDHAVFGGAFEMNRRRH